MKPSSSKARQEPDFAAGQFGLSNEQVVERVEIDQIKLPRSVRKIGPRAIALCKANLQRFGQPGPILVSETLDLVHGEETLLAAREPRASRRGVGARRRRGRARPGFR